MEKKLFFAGLGVEIVAIAVSQLWPNIPNIVLWALFFFGLVLIIYAIIPWEKSKKAKSSDLTERLPDMSFEEVVTRVENNFGISTVKALHEIREKCSWGLLTVWGKENPPDSPNSRNEPRKKIRKDYWSQYQFDYQDYLKDKRGRTEPVIHGALGHRMNELWFNSNEIEREFPVSPISIEEPDEGYNQIIRRVLKIGTPPRPTRVQQNRCRIKVKNNNDDPLENVMVRLEKIIDLESGESFPYSGLRQPLRKSQQYLAKNPDKNFYLKPGEDEEIEILSHYKTEHGQPSKDFEIGLAFNQKKTPTVSREIPAGNYELILGVYSKKPLSVKPHFVIELEDGLAKMRRKEN